jgi:hypothetical protein
MGRLYSTNVGVKNACKDMDSKPERMRPVGRHLCRWIFKDIIWQGFDWVCLCQDAKSCWVCSNEPIGVLKSRYFLYFHRDH